MDIQLYKEGDTHTVRGVKCELKNFRYDQLESAIKDGWYKTPGEWLKEEPKTEQKEIQKSDPDHPVRQAAKEAGIDGWDSKRISTLEKELDGSEK